MIRRRRVKAAAQTEQTVIVKCCVISGKLAAVGRRYVLPADSFTEMNSECFGICKFPAFYQVPLHKLCRTEMSVVSVYRRVQCPVIGEKSFHPGRVDIRQHFREKRVEIGDIPINTQDDFAAVLRLAEFFPPPLGFLFHHIPHR